MQARSYGEPMNKFLILALSLALCGFNLAIPAFAHCGHCEGDEAAGSSDSSSAAAAPAKSVEKKEKKTIDKRVSDLEQSLKDVSCGCSDNGSPYTSKGASKKISAAKQS